jgi:Spy/CpxP family protein refolding chaperone
MKNKVLIATLAAALVAGGFMVTQNNARAGETPISAGAGSHRGWLQRIADRLDLTPDQRAQIKGVLDREKDNLTPLLSSVHEARKNLRAAIRAEDASESAVRAAAAEVAAAESNLAVERMKLYGKIAPILTDAQRQQLAEMQQKADEFVDNVINGIGSGF